MAMPSVASLALGLLASVVCAHVGAACTTRESRPGTEAGNAWVTRANWLEAGTLRFGVTRPAQFMPGLSVAPASAAASRPAASWRLDPDRVSVTDPADDSTRSLRFLLENRIDADGVIILRQGRTLLDYRRSGFDPAAPRLLQSATRPILVAWLARAASEGRLARDKAINRLIPELGDVRELGKRPVQRLLDGRTGLGWGDDEIGQWRSVAGWTAAPGADLRGWLKARPVWPRAEGEHGAEAIGPGGELLVWVVEKARRQPVAALLCEMQERIGARHPAFWATDGVGTALADGLALSLEDFASFGQALLDARGRPGRRTYLPAWFADALAAGGGQDAERPAAVKALGADVGWQYHFAHPGRRTRQAAIVGENGSSLLVDFDRGLVIAMFASHAQRESPLLMASLRRLWEMPVSTGGRRGKKG
ncbi:serine hydrolase domain-containing protein [Zoogloea dura]|jgi:hypothetical protein|uniref:Serine hydrolase n=1 Tax=Zoogloea dura TaxID=2728840 RepID=A0A848G5M1_9RHOO|nr:hypothetical protein [Zoogloea dura]NML26482.1 hypothetical protein [Zoogloea dura]